MSKVATAEKTPVQTEEIGEPVEQIHADNELPRAELIDMLDRMEKHRWVLDSVMKNALKARSVGQGEEQTIELYDENGEVLISFKPNKLETLKEGKRAA